jgi:calcineurin-like phosphoesterase family protein
MRRFFTADPHWGHDKLRKIYCNERAKIWPDIQKHDHGLINRWNAKVGKEDETYILGDVAFADLPRLTWILSQLNGTKHLILGNHDQEYIPDYIRAGFASVSKYKFINIKGIGAVGLAHDPAVCICMPDIPWLVGHLHWQFLRMNNAINVGMDVRNFAPVSEAELEEDFRVTKIHMKSMITEVENFKKEMFGKEK